MLRKLRITAACLCFALSVALLVLWVRSFANFDHVRYRGDRIYLRLFLDRGQFNSELEYSPNSEFQQLNNQDFIKHTLIIETNPIWNGPIPAPGYRIYSHNRRGNLVAFIGFRYWLPTVTIALLALLLKPQPRFRVSLREVFVLTTLAAVTIGTITAVFRLAD